MTTLLFGIGGVGRALAERLLRGGGSVHLIARNEQKLAAVKDELITRGCDGSKVRTTVMDMMKVDEVEAGVKMICETHSGAAAPTGLVYAVGSIPLKPLKSMSAQDFLDAYTLNFLSGALTLKAAAPFLASHKTAPGSAVFFSTVAAHVGFPNHTGIASSKGAIEAFVRSAGAELAPKIRINAIAPSLSDTPLASRMLSNESMKKQLGEAHPIPRLGTSDDSAAMAEFLLSSEKAGWISGQIFHVDGGRSTLRPKN
jgi:NAD(P)-dependent dehydrogenase (short-subunit alcohol dehydrogenase family)